MIAAMTTKTMFLLTNSPSRLPGWTATASAANSKRSDRATGEVTIAIPTTPKEKEMKKSTFLTGQKQRIGLFHQLRTSISSYCGPHVADLSPPKSPIKQYPASNRDGQGRSTSSGSLLCFLFDMYYVVTIPSTIGCAGDSGMEALGTGYRHCNSIFSLRSMKRAMCKAIVVKGRP